MPSDRPTIGRIVIYRSRTGNYSVPAIITAAQDTLWEEGVLTGMVPPLSSPDHVHLHVITPGGQRSYQEHDVSPAGPRSGRRLDMRSGDQLAAGEQEDGAIRQNPRTWAWPTR